MDLLWVNFVQKTLTIFHCFSDFRLQKPKKSDSVKSSLCVSTHEVCKYIWEELSQLASLSLVQEKHMEVEAWK